MAAWCPLIHAQAGECFGTELRVVRGHLPDQVEEQRQRARRAVRDRFMLQCTIRR